MRRKLFNLAAAVSLVLCVATAVLWIRSWYVGELLGRVDRSSVYVRSEGGGVNVYGYNSNRGLPDGWNYMSWKPEPINWHPEGFSYSNGVSTPADLRPFRRGGKSPQPFSYVAISIPYWSLALLFALLPALRLPHVIRRRLRRLRRKSGNCLTCGYDLRATPERCPECGTVAPPRGPAAGSRV